MFESLGKKLYQAQVDCGPILSDVHDRGHLPELGGVGRCSPCTDCLQEFWPLARRDALDDPVRKPVRDGRVGCRQRVHRRFVIDEYRTRLGIGLFAHFSGIESLQA